MSELRLTDGGLETSLIFDQGLELPSFAAFPLVDTDEGRAALRTYFEPYLDLAAAHGVGFVLDTPTWRANPDWAGGLGYDDTGLHAANRAAVEFARQLAAERAPGAVTVQGVVGPRGDGYRVEVEMTADEAAAYHLPQIRALAAAGADAGADQVAAITFAYEAEALGFLRSAGEVGIPAVVSFTSGTDGCLPNGRPLREAVERVDEQTGGRATGFMINCAHPTHFADALTSGDWLARIVGVRANASALSHAELDESADLDEGDPDDLARHYAALLDRLPALAVLGGCCGTSERHIRAIAEACLPG